MNDFDLDLDFVDYLEHTSELRSECQSCGQYSNRDTVVFPHGGRQILPVTFFKYFQPTALGHAYGGGSQFFSTWVVSSMSR